MAPTIVTAFSMGDLVPDYRADDATHNRTIPPAKALTGQGADSRAKQGSNCPLRSLRLTVQAKSTSQYQCAQHCNAFGTGQAD